MITLATLKDATAQEVFDQVANHLLKQGKRSRSDDVAGECAYRGDNGMMCAAGCLIADSEYVRDMDYKRGGTGWDDLQKAGLVPSDHGELILQLQYIHDGDEREWVERLSDFAEANGLKFNNEGEK